MAVVPAHTEVTLSSLSTVSGFRTSRAIRGFVVGVIVLTAFAGLFIGISALALTSSLCQEPSDGDGGGARRISENGEWSVWCTEKEAPVDDERRRAFYTGVAREVWHRFQRHAATEHFVEMVYSRGGPSMILQDKASHLPQETDLKKHERWADTLWKVLDMYREESLFPSIESNYKRTQLSDIKKKYPNEDPDQIFQSRIAQRRASEDVIAGAIESYLKGSGRIGKPVVNAVLCLPPGYKDGEKPEVTSKKDFICYMGPNMEYIRYTDLKAMRDDNDQKDQMVWFLTLPEESYM